MLAINVILEDTKIEAKRDTGLWVGVITDMITGKIYSFHWYDYQLATVLALAVGGDEVAFTQSKHFSEAIVKEMYQIAEKAISGCPKECRPIP
jgi:hypothetical protein